MNLQNCTSKSKQHWKIVFEFNLFQFSISTFFCFCFWGEERKKGWLCCLVCFRFIFFFRETKTQKAILTDNITVTPCHRVNIWCISEQSKVYFNLTTLLKTFFILLRFSFVCLENFLSCLFHVKPNSTFMLFIHG